MLWPDPINQLSLFDKALFLHQYGTIIDSYKENNIKHTVYLIDGNKVELMYNITNSQIQDICIKEKVDHVFNS
jgi:hypothetical protein